MPREFAAPGTRPRYAPDRPIDVEHYRIAVALFPEQRRIAGTTAVTARVLAPSVTRLTLDAVELQISEVREGGASRRFRHDGRAVVIELGEPRPVGARFTVEIAYEAQPRRGLYFVGPDAGYPAKPAMVWTQGQDEDSRCWFPCVDAPHDKATTEVIAEVPSIWSAISNGELVSDQTAGDRRTLHWRHATPHSSYLVTLVAGDLATIEERWRDVPVTYHAARGREADARRTLARTPAMMEFFSTKLGVAYPYPRYAQVFVPDFIFGGMENTTATTLTDAYLLDERAEIDHDEDPLIAHELAHQWFGDLVTCRDWGEGWLNEGFATYAEYLWSEHRDGRDSADVLLDEFGAMYLHEDGCRYRRTIATKLYDEPLDIFDHHLYDKGGRVLHMLRQVLGDELFWKSLRHYLDKHRHGVVETRDLARAIEDATGRVLDWFFSQWVLEGAGHPELKVNATWDDALSALTVVVEQVQKLEGKTPLFRLPAIVRVRVDGCDVDLPVEVTERRHVFHLRLEREPTHVIFDPGRTILATLEVDQSPARWIDQLAGATLAIDRGAAAHALGTKGGAQATAALVAALRGDRFWAVRGAAAAALANLRGDAARDELVAALAAERHPRARRAIVKALGEFRGSAVVGSVLAEVVERGDPSGFVEAEACLALGRTRVAHAPAVLRAASSRSSYLDAIRAHCWRGLAEARHDGSVDTLIEASRWGMPSEGRRAAAAALAQLGKGRRDRDGTRIREHLEDLLDDRDYRVQMSALEGLGTLGDPAAITALERAIGRALDGRVRRRAGEIVRDLGERSGSAADANRLHDQLGELRTQVAGLRDRLERLEARDLPKQKAGKKTAKKADKAARKRDRS